MEKLIVPLSLIFSLAGFAAIAMWYVIPASDKQPRDIALVPLLLPQAFRHIGLWFLIPGAVASSLPQAFAVPAAWGDFVAAIFAWLAIIALRARWSLATPILWAFSLWGILDLVDALVRGNLFLPSAGDLGATFYIPAIVVPALFVSHVLILRRLIIGR